MGVHTTRTPYDVHSVARGVIGIKVDVDCDFGTNLENHDKLKLDEFGLQILANIEHSIQHSPRGMFRRRDLIWCHTPLHEESPNTWAQGDPRVAPGICGAVGEGAQVILIWVRARALGMPPHTETRSHASKADVKIPPTNL